MMTERGLPIFAEFDFLQKDLQTWSIFAESTTGEKMALHMVGTILVGTIREIDGKLVIQEKESEYAREAHFYQLVRAGKSDADFSPLRQNSSSNRVLATCRTYAQK